MSLGQVYPEYLVIYERLHGGATASAPREDLPFQLDLPFYWRMLGTKLGQRQETKSLRIVPISLLLGWNGECDGCCGRLLLNARQNSKKNYIILSSQCGLLRSKIPSEI